MHNLIIIGSGPAGWTAAIYAARAELKPLLFEGSEPGGQLLTTTDVENYPGFPKGILGPELMSACKEQAKRFGTEIIGAIVDSVRLNADGTYTVTANKKEYQTKAVILSTGASARRLGLESEKALFGKGVSACATCDGFFFKEKNVMVVGGGDSAMEEANFLTKFASHVTVIHRSDTFRASKIMLKRAESNPKISFLKNTVVTEVLGTENVTGVKLLNSVTNEASELAVQGYFVAIGHTPVTNIFKEAGVETDERGYIIPKVFTETNISGVFVAGDVHDHRYRQAVTAAGEGCKAALDVEKYLANQE